MRSRVLAFLLALAALVASPATAQLPSGSSEALRESVERVRDDPSYLVQGEAIAARRVLAELYANRDFAPAWGSANAREELLRAVRDSAHDGLDPTDYHAAALERLRGEIEAGAAADVWLDYDLLQTDALARLLYHLIFGKLDPSEVSPHWNFYREVDRGDPARFLQKVIDAPSLYSTVENEKPQHEMYRELRGELARYRALREAGGWREIPPGPTLKPGMRDARVGALRARLAATGQLAEGAASGGDLTLYDAAVEAGVRAFQAQNGLDADGAVGAGTLAVLNLPIDARIAQIEVNLERARWLLHEVAPTFVVVNVAGFRVYYVRDNKLVWSARAQVGKPYRQTPIFRSVLSYLVLNPTWTVPPGIFANDILPAQKRDPGYLAKRGLVVVDAQGERVTAPIDWASVTPRNFRYMLRQEPGPDNALGRVKFMFPNQYSVYLHDTPSRALFEKSDRAFSSGCIRVDDPLELATLLLAGQPGWDRAAIDAAIAAGKTRTITLQNKVPVLLSYWTAWVDRDGALQFRRDLYGRDEKVLAALRAPFKVHRRL